MLFASQPIPLVASAPGAGTRVRPPVVLTVAVVRVCTVEPLAATSTQAARAASWVCRGTRPPKTVRTDCRWVSPAAQGRSEEPAYFGQSRVDRQGLGVGRRTPL